MIRVLTGFRFLRTVSAVHSVVYGVLLWAALSDGDEGLRSVLGWAHGLLWIFMAGAVIVAVRRRTLPLWLAVTVAVVGGVGPFAGTVGFLVETRRRTVGEAARPATGRALE